MTKEQLALQLFILAIQSSDDLARLFMRGTTSEDLDRLTGENTEARAALQAVFDKMPEDA